MVLLGNPLFHVFVWQQKAFITSIGFPDPQKDPLNTPLFFALPVTHSWVEIIHPLQKQKLRGRRDVTTFQTLGSSQSI